MTLELPALPDDGEIGPDELRLELACALYARGRIGKIKGAELANVDLFTFQAALRDRRVPVYTDEMLAGDMETLQKLFPA